MVFASREHLANVAWAYTLLFWFSNTRNSFVRLVYDGHKQIQVSQFVLDLAQSNE